MEDGGINIFSFIGKMLSLGVTNIFCTDISKDGAMEGPSVDLYQSILEQYPEIKLIASGGVSELNDLLVLDALGCQAAIVGKAIYEGKVPLNPMKDLNESYIYFK